MNIETERWRPIPTWDFYDASDLGNVRSLPRTVTRKDGASYPVRGCVLKPVARGREGRRTVCLYGIDRKRIYMVSQLVLSAFVGLCPDGLEACHEDGNHLDDRLDNLRWDTHSANLLDRQRHGTDPKRNQERCSHGHLLAHPNLVAWSLKPDGKRRPYRLCLACNRTWAAQWKARSVGRPFDFQAESDSKYQQIMKGVLL